MLRQLDGDTATGVGRVPDHWAGPCRAVLARHRRPDRPIGGIAAFRLTKRYNLKRFVPLSLAPTQVALGVRATGYRQGVVTESLVVCAHIWSLESPEEY